MEVFYLDLEKIELENLSLNKYHNFLDHTELKRFNNIADIEVKRNFILGRFLIKSKISEKLNCKASDIIIYIGKNGRPQLKNHLLNFNLSHSQDLITLAIGKQDVGIDIQLKKDKEFLKISQYLFSQKEHNSLEKMAQQGKTKELKNLFYCYWSLREAIIKCNCDVILNKSVITDFILEFDKKNLVKNIKSNFDDKYKFYMPFIKQNYSCALAIKSIREEYFTLSLQEVFIQPTLVQNHH